MGSFFQHLRRRQYDTPCPGQKKKARRRRDAHHIIPNGYDYSCVNKPDEIQQLSAPRSSSKHSAENENPRHAFRLGALLRRLKPSPVNTFLPLSRHPKLTVPCICDCSQNCSRALICAPPARHHNSSGGQVKPMRHKNTRPPRPFSILTILIPADMTCATKSQHTWVPPVFTGCA
ncbi:unnamed protein product, partial [Ectocarpus sp. 12 AP-2014]